MSSSDSPQQGAHQQNQALNQPGNAQAPGQPQPPHADVPAMHAANGGANPLAEPPLSADAAAMLPFVDAVLATAPRTEIEAPANNPPRQPRYIGRP